MMHCKFSILVPVYGTEQYIGRCCKSLFSQNYDNIEYIFVDDCTKDRSIDVIEEVLREFPDRKSQTRIIHHEVNRGLGAARLTGLDNATGDYVWFVDSDDYIATDAIEKLAGIVNSNDYDLVTFSYYEDKDNIISPRILKNFTVQDLLTDRVNPSIWKNVIKRSFMLEADIKPIEGVDYAEDLHLLYRLVVSAKKKLVLSDHFCYYYNISNDDSMDHNVSLKSILSLLKAIEVVIDYYRNYGIISKYKPFLAFLLADSILKIKDSVDSVFYKEILGKVHKLDTIIYIVAKLNANLNFKMSLLYWYRNKRYQLLNL
jgi:glycosyltransferase involved in cell wall biosynthesis